MKPEALPEAGTRRYAVFLSYRHADNKEPGRQWATWLHQMLENYEIPSDLAGTANGRGDVIPTSLYPVFRDEEELPADADLTRNIREALENSEVLAVICSPRAVQSRFVAEEIRYFKELGKADRIIAVMIDGEPNTTDDDAKQSAELTAEMECLPEPLRRGVAGDDGRIDWNARTEPIAADARPGGRPVQGWTTSAAYREQLLREGRKEKSNLATEIKSYEQRLELTKLKVVAGAIGVPLGVLTQRDKAMQLEKARKRARTLRRWLAAVAALALIAIAGGILAWEKQREAAQERDAKEQARIEEAKQRRLAQEQSEQRRRLLVEAARSDRLAAEERLGRGESPAAFAYLARSIIYDGASTFAAEKAIAALNTWCFARPVAFCEHGSDVVCAHFSPDSQRIVSAARYDTIARVWDAQSGKVLVNLKATSGFAFPSPHFSPDGQQIVTASDDTTAQLWDVQTGKLLTTFKGHGMNVREGQFSPDGEKIVTSSTDQTVRVWETQSGKALTILRGPGYIMHAQFSRDGRHVVADSDEATALVWDADSGKLLTIHQGRRGIWNRAQLSPDGQRIITVSGDTTAQIWDVQSSKLLATLQGHTGQVNRAQFASDGQRLVTTSFDKTARVWETQTGRPLTILQGHRDILNDAQFSPDGQRIVTASYDNTARVWDGETGQLLTIFQGNGVMNSAEFSSDGERVVTASSDKIARMWEVQSGKLLVTLQGHQGVLNDAQFSPDGHHIVTASRDKTARVWDLQSGKLVVTLQSHDATVRSAQFSSDGQRIVTASDDNSARVWEVQSGKLLVTLQGHEGIVNGARFGPNGERIVTASQDHTARIWDAQSGKLLASLQGHTNKVGCAEFSPDGERIVTASDDKSARVWDASNGKLSGTLQGHTGQVRSAQFSPDGQKIVTTSDDRTARIWNVQSGKLLATLQGHESVVQTAQFSADGRYIVTGSTDDTGRVWEVQSGNLLATLRGHVDHLCSAEFSPDGQRIVTASFDRTARVWETQSGRLVATLEGHEGVVKRARFSPDGKRIVTASDDKTARVWTILTPSAGAPPPWFVDFLHYMGQQRLNSNGELEPIPPTDWLAIRDRLDQVIRESATQDTPYLGILRHFVHGASAKSATTPPRVVKPSVEPTSPLLSAKASGPLESLSPSAPPNDTGAQTPNNADTSPIAQVTGSNVKILSAPQPPYPHELETKHIGGSGRFEIDFDENGNAKSVQPIESTGNRLLDSNTVRTFMQWRASPGSTSKIVVPITYAKPKSSPRLANLDGHLAPPSPARLRRCRIISLKRPGEVLTVRKGPGANFPVIARYSFHQSDLIRAGEGSGQRSLNAGTTWHALYSVKGSFIGWVEEGYLSDEGD